MRHCHHYAVQQCSQCHSEMQSLGVRLDRHFEFDDEEQLRRDERGFFNRCSHTWHWCLTRANAQSQILAWSTVVEARVTGYLRR